MVRIGNATYCSRCIIISQFSIITRWSQCHLTAGEQSQLRMILIIYSTFPSFHRKHGKKLNPAPNKMNCGKQRKDVIKKSQVERNRRGTSE